MIDETAVTPVDPNAMPAAPAEEAPAPESNLSDEVLQIPFLQAIFAGTPAAASFNIKAAEKTPEAKLVAQNRQGLQENGINFYRSLAGDVGVVFNSLKISGADIQAADKNGKLLEIAPPADKVSQDILASGSNHPALSQGAPANAPAAPQGAPPPQSASNPMPMTPGPSAGQARQKLAAQMKNLSLGAPTSGPAAGRGQLLRSILKPVL